MNIAGDWQKTVLAAKAEVEILRLSSSDSLRMTGRKVLGELSLAPGACCEVGP